MFTPQVNEPIKIIVIEDDPLQIEFLRSGFSEVGCDVTFYEEAQSLNYSQIAKADIVLLDIILETPFLDGHSVLKELRKISSVPVIIQSSRNDEIERILGFELGADDYIPKPYSFRELFVRVKNILKRSRRCSECEAVKDVLNGGGYEQWLAKITESISEPLSPRQKDVLQGLYFGKSNKEIANDLNVSTHTVKSHVSGLLKLLKISSRAKIGPSFFPEN